MNLVVRAKEDLDSVLRKLRSGGDEITLEIAPDWDLGEEIRGYLDRKAN